MSKKILIIDDEADVMRTVVYRLKAKGYEVVTAGNGKDGIEMARTNRPDLILLDFRLPDLEAKDIANQIRATEGNGQVLIILATASIDAIEDKARSCGAADYMTKPFSPEILYAKVEKQIGLL